MTATMTSDRRSRVHTDKQYSRVITPDPNVDQEEYETYMQQVLAAGAPDANSVTRTNPVTSTIVQLESPYAADSNEQLTANLAYARAALRDSLLRGETPFASHLLYTQDGVLDDTIPHERAMGIEAGLAMHAVASRVVVYADHGISLGMNDGITRALARGLVVEYRSIATTE